MNIAVFVSGNGTNLQALMDAESAEGLAGGRIVLVVSDNPGAFALRRARKNRIETFVLENKGFGSREEYDKEVVKRLRKNKIELIVFAGYMRIVSDYFLGEYPEKIINVHPSLLPAFKGAHGIKDAYEAGVKETGVTVHFVTSELDAGPIILQRKVLIEAGDDLNALEEKIHREEHRLYPEAVRMVVGGRVTVKGDEVT